MTRYELLKKIQTQNGKEELAEKIARVWWDRLDMDAAESAYISLSIFGYVGLMTCTQAEWLEHAEDAGLLDEDDPVEGPLLTLEEFIQWTVDGKINGEHYDAQIIFEAMQKRIWECPECKAEGTIYRKEVSYDDIVKVGQPMCPDGHLMEQADG